MLWEVRVSYKRGVQDSEGESALKGLRALGFGGIAEVSTAKVYVIRGNCSRKDVEEVCRRLLASPVSQDYTIRGIEGEDE